MAGTLTLSTISDGTNSTSVTNAIQGSAKAWARWVGSSGTISSSYNVSSVTRNATADYSVNFTNAMPDGNYTVNVSGSDEVNSQHTVPYIINSYVSTPQPYSTTAVKVGFWNAANSGNRVDKNFVSIIVMR